MNLNSEQNISNFYNIVEAEKYYDNNAALIIIEESEYMLNRPKMVLELLVHHKKLLINDINVADRCFCYTIHEMIPELELRKRCNKDYEKFKEEIYNFINGFVQLYKI